MTNGHHELALFLFENNIGIEGGADGCTPLMSAIMLNSSEIVLRTFCKSKKDRQQRLSAKPTTYKAYPKLNALELAAACDNLVALKLLNDSKTRFTPHPERCNLLHLAKRSGALLVYQHLLETKPELAEKTNNTDHTPLFTCVSTLFKSANNPGPDWDQDKADKEVSAVLGLYAPHMKKADKSKQLTVTSILPHINTLWMLLHHGFELTAKALRVLLSDVEFETQLRQQDEEQSTTLHLASKLLSGEVEMEAYLKAGVVVVDQMDIVGLTALHYAVQHNRIAIVYMLLKYGASPDKLGQGYTALHLACAFKYYELIPLLITRSKSLDTKSTKTKVTAAYLLATENTIHLKTNGTKTTVTVDQKVSEELFRQLKKAGADFTSKMGVDKASVVEALRDVDYPDDFIAQISTPML